MASEHFILDDASSFHKLPAHCTAALSVESSCLHSKPNCKPETPQVCSLVPFGDSDRTSRHRKCHCFCQNPFHVSWCLSLRKFRKSAICLCDPFSSGRNSSFCRLITSLMVPFLFFLLMSCSSLASSAATCLNSTSCPLYNSSACFNVSIYQPTVFRIPQYGTGR